MAENEVDLLINVDTKDATKSINNFSKTAKDQVKGIESAFEGLGTAVKVALAAFAGFKLVEKAIDAASEADAAVQRLNISLASTGEFSKESSESIQAFASNLQELTGISDEAILGAVSLAKTFGITNDQAVDLTKAAFDLAAATGTDLDTAVRQLGGTYSGTVGKLAKLGPEFKKLTEEQLRNGEAVKLIGNRFQGTAEALSNTFSGAVDKAKVSLGDIFENFGKIITQNPAVIVALNEVAKVFKQISEIGTQNQSGASGVLSSIIGSTSKGGALAAGIIQTVIDGVKNLVSIVGIFFSVVADLINVPLKGLTIALSFIERGFFFAKGSLDSFIASLLTVASKIPGASDSFKTLAASFTKDATKSFDIVSGKVDTTSAEIGDKLGNAISLAGLDFVNAAEDINKQLDKVNGVVDIFGVGAATAADKIDGLGKSVVDTSKDIKNLDKNTEKFIDNSAELELLKGSFDKVKASVEQLQKAQDEQGKGVFELIELEVKRANQLADNAARELEIQGKASKQTDALIRQFKDLQEAKANASAQTVVANGVLQGIDAALSGKSGAIALGSKIAGTIADSFLPGIGPLVSSIFGKLAAGKEQAKEFVKEFISSIPEIMAAIIEAIPAVVEAFIEVLGRPSFWIAIGKVLAKSFIVSLLTFFLGPLGIFFLDKAVAFGERVGDLIVQKATAFGDKIAAGFNNFFAVFDGAIRPIADIFTAFGDTMTQVFESTAGAFNSVADKISNTFGTFSNILTSITNGLSSLFEPLVNALISLERAVSSAGSIGGKGGGGGIIAETADRIGLRFADGGIVPKVASGIDRVPALVTPGELVIPTDLVGSLASFLSNQGNTSGGQDTAVLMAILQAVQQPITVQAEAKVNQNAFADILLQLNRQNARVSA